MKKVFKPLLIKFEKWYHIKRNMKHVPGSEVKYMRYEIIKYNSTTREIDGITVKKGDKIMMLHYDNIEGEKLSNELFKILRSLRSELKLLAKGFNEKTVEDVEIIYTVGLMHPLLKMVGFTIYDMENKFNEWKKGLWDSFLLKTFSDLEHNRKEKLIPKECLMTKQQLFQRYLK